MNGSNITCALIPAGRRAVETAAYFGHYFPLRLEPAIYQFAEQLSRDYQGGYWDFYTLGNGGFYMAPDDDQPFQVSSENGWEGQLSADALGIVSLCL